MITSKWIVIGLVVVGVGSIAAYGVRAAVPPAGVSDLSAKLYSGWRDQMKTVVYTSRPVLPARPLVRLQQVWRIEGQNQRAAGMVSMVQRLGGGGSLVELTNELANINFGIDEMLMRMSTGYTGNPSSRAAAVDIRYIRRLVQVTVLKRLPVSLSSDAEVQHVLPILRSLDRYIAREVNVRFVKPGGKP